MPTQTQASPIPPVKRKRFVWVKRILLTLVVAIAIFAVVVALQPAEYSITRSATIAAPPADVFAHVNDLRKWDAWSPWARLDPAAKYTYGGPPAGVDSTVAWAGNDKVGEGQMTITESRPAEYVAIKLEFVKPFADTCKTEFAFKPAAANATGVTWTMSGHRNFMAKAICLFMDMEKMVGGDFERGLAQMKTVAESQRK
jgi:hypothetical protein